MTVSNFAYTGNYDDVIYHLFKYLIYNTLRILAAADFSGLRQSMNEWGLIRVHHSQNSDWQAKKPAPSRGGCKHDDV